jgi:hypothetical protein
MVSEDRGECYISVGPDLSQGDIVRIIPFGRIDAPVTICQPSNTKPSGKALYYQLDDLPKRRGVEFLHAKFKLGMGIVVWPDCQIDKPKNQGRPEQEWYAGIAPVIPFSELASNLHDKVRTFNRAQWFPLPAKTPELPESYVDLRYIWQVRYSLLADRILALSESARQAFSLHRFWFDTEVRARAEVDCPHCHKPINSSIFFHYKDSGE